MAKATSQSLLLSYRLQVALRVLLAAVGGYFATVVTAIFLVNVLPLSRSDAVVTSALSTFVIYTLAVIWVFSAHSLRRATIGLLSPTLILAVINFIFLSLGGTQ